MDLLKLVSQRLAEIHYFVFFPSSLLPPCWLANDVDAPEGIASHLQTDATHSARLGLEESGFGDIGGL